MPIKNPTQFLVDFTKYPAAIEEKLPAGAPKISATLVDIANKLPVVPDLPMELPDLPAVPTLPEIPAAAGLMRRRYVTGVEVAPVGRAAAPVATNLRSAQSQLVFE